MGRWGAIACGLWCVFACGVIGVRVAQGNVFDSDIQSLLPQNAIEPVVRAAIVQAGKVGAGRAAVLVAADDPARASLAAADLERAFIATGMFRPDRLDGQEIGRWLFANRNQLICEMKPELYDAEQTVKRSLGMLYGPAAPVSGDMLLRDPFLLTLQLAQCLMPAWSTSLGGATLVSGRLLQSAFSIDVQDTVIAAYDVWRTRWPDVRPARAGAIFYAQDGATRARNEISVIGIVSLAAVLLCLIVCFIRWQPLFGTLAVTAAGAAGSLAAALLVFPSIHVLVFVFGSALIGVTSDYALHYLATGPQTNWAPPADRLRHVFRPLLVCVTATSLGFASLGLFGLPIFNQVAVFAVAGIVTAWWFTVTILPMMDRHPRRARQLSAWWARLEAPLLRLHWTRARVLICSALIAVAAIAGIARFRVLDDVRQFQPRDTLLVTEEARVREAIGFTTTPKFLLSYAATADGAREREYAALASLPDAARRDVLASSRLHPPVAVRAASGAVLRDKLFTPHLAARAEILGRPQLDPIAAPPAELPSAIAALSGQYGNMSFLVAPLGALAGSQPFAGDGIMLVDPGARYSSAFATYRKQAGWAFAAALATCAVVVVFLYRTLRAMTILAGPAIGAALGLAIPSAFDVPTSFFSIVALFVVIGAGIDHSVFQFEAAEAGGAPMELAVFIAALTTILSMGLLGFSATYPVQCFGLVVSVGVSIAYLFSFIPGRLAGKRNHGYH